MKDEKQKYQRRKFLFIFYFLFERGSRECGSKTERKVYIKDQHPSREEIA
jgi:hypothetical protein